MDNNAITVQFIQGEHQGFQHQQPAQGFLHEQPAVNVRTPYNPGNDWNYTNPQTHTVPIPAVRQVLIDMVTTRLRAKGLPMIECSHTTGLQLDNVINWLVESHKYACIQPSQYQQVQSSQGIPLQDINDDDNYEVQDAVQSILTPTFPRSQNLPKKNVPSTGQQNLKRKTGQQSLKRKAVSSKATPQKRSKSSTSLTTTSVNMIKCGNMLKCGKCDKLFKNAWDLRKHQVAHTQDRPYKCTDCDQHFKSIGECTKHHKFIHLKKFKHHCPVCGKGYPSNSIQFIEHQRKHLNVADKDKPFVCRHCGKGFWQNRQLNEHLALHEEDKRFKCDLCPHTSATRKTRRRHVNQTHKVFWSKKSNKCLECDLELHEYHILIEHMKQNHEIAGIKCDECGAMFKNDNMLNMHMKRAHKTKFEEQMKKMRVKRIEELKTIVHRKKKAFRELKRDQKKAKKQKNLNPKLREEFKRRYKFLNGDLRKSRRELVYLNKIVKASESTGKSEEKMVKASESNGKSEEEKGGPSHKPKKKRKRPDYGDGGVTLELDGVNKLLFQCSICRTLYINSQALNQHMHLEHSRYMTRRKCDEAFLSENVVHVDLGADRKKGTKTKTKHVRKEYQEISDSDDEDQEISYIDYDDQDGSDSSDEEIESSDSFDEEIESSDSSDEDQDSDCYELKPALENFTPSSKQSIIIVEKTAANQKGNTTSKSTKKLPQNESMKKLSPNTSKSMNQSSPITSKSAKNLSQNASKSTKEGESAPNASDSTRKPHKYLLNINSNSIYSKSSHDIAQILKKGSLKLSLQMEGTSKRKIVQFPIPQQVDSAINSDVNISIASASGASTSSTNESSPNTSESTKEMSTNTIESTKKSPPNTSASTKESSPFTSESAKESSPNTIVSTKKSPPNTIESTKKSPPNTSASSKELCPITSKSIKELLRYTIESTKKSSPNTSASTKESSPITSESAKQSSTNTIESTKKSSPNTSASTKELSPDTSKSSKQPQKYLTIYTKSPDQVAQLLKIGNLKLSLQMKDKDKSSTKIVQLSIPRQVDRKKMESDVNTSHASATGASASLKSTKESSPNTSKSTMDSSPNRTIESSKILSSNTSKSTKDLPQNTSESTIDSSPNTCASESTKKLSPMSKSTQDSPQNTSESTKKSPPNLSQNTSESTLSENKSTNLDNA